MAESAYHSESVKEQFPTDIHGTAHDEGQDLDVTSSGVVSNSEANSVNACLTSITNAVYSILAPQQDNASEFDNSLSQIYETVENVIDVCAQESRMPVIKINGKYVVMSEEGYRGEPSGDLQAQEGSQNSLLSCSLPPTPAHEGERSLDSARQSVSTANSGPHSVLSRSSDNAWPRDRVSTASGPYSATRSPLSSGCESALGMTGKSSETLQESIARYKVWYICTLYSYI